MRKISKTAVWASVVGIVIWLAGTALLIFGETLPVKIVGIVMFAIGLTLPAWAAVIERRGQ
ncbi:hypothetical protein [Leifsonia sp. A12D58]|uniref:hypothetical protein n=1 Tax=Leifsonia sp. A12D58 TaxID=3397674 RepID=UPI0039E08F2E